MNSSVTNKFASKCATIWPKCAQKCATEEFGQNVLKNGPKKIYLTIFDPLVHFYWKGHFWAPLSETGPAPPTPFFFSSNNSEKF